MKIINPATDEVIQEVQTDTIDTLKSKFDSLKKGQKTWKKETLEHRIECIKKYQSGLKENIEELAATMTSEMGKPLQESRNEINGACGRIDFFISQSQNWLNGKEVANDGTTREVLTFEPLGVVANISAWNYPFLVGVNVQIPALIAGNSVLYKPSEFTLLTGLKMQELFHKAGVPQDVFQTVSGAGDIGKAILDLPINGLFFTGSYNTGKVIHQALSDKLIPVGLELGGKDPLYVTDDIADVDASAASAVEGSFYNNGQSCCAVERIYVHEKVYDKFLESFVKHTKALKVGDPTQEGTTQGSIARPVHLDFLEEQIKDAVDKGATLLTGGKRIVGKGAFFEPTVLSNVSHEMRVMKEETFGPVIGIQKVSSDEQAITLMDDTKYGLTAGVFSQNKDRAQEILEQLEVGNAYQNCSDRVSPYLPWAGQRGSGLGATLSYLGILAFVRPKGFHFRG